MKAACLIPIYNNPTTIADVVAGLLPLATPILIVNDGSQAATREVLAKLEAETANLRVLHLPQNGGKGVAVRRGMQQLHREGFTHALTLDADGQHDPSYAPQFLAMAQREPTALILGSPIYSADAPKARLYGRKLSQWCVWLETWSRQIDDPLVGYRCYPLAPCHDLFQSNSPGGRMDFDPEIAVRLVWQGLKVRNIQVAIHYPPGGVSHFNYLSDNIRITWMHTRLIIGGLLRAPKLLRQKASP